MPGTSGAWREWAWRNRVLLLALPAMLVLGVTVFYPVARLFIRSVLDPDLTANNYVHLVQTPAYIRVMTYTLQISVAVTAGCILLGYPVAYLLAHARPAVRNLLFVFVLFPFWTSVLVRAYGWMVILGQNGLINRALMALGLIREPLPLMFNTGGVLVGMVHYMLPFMVLAIYSVMAGIDGNIVRAAASLGATSSQSFLRVYLPLSAPGIVAGSMLVFLLSLGFFVTPTLLGGQSDVMIAMLVNFLIGAIAKWNVGSALSFALFALVFFLVFLYSRVASLEQIFGRRTQ